MIPPASRDPPSGTPAAPSDRSHRRSAAPAAGHPRGGRPGARPFVVGLGVSFLLHAVAIFLYPLLTAPGPNPGAPLAPASDVPDGVRVVEVREVPEATVVRPDEPEPAAEPPEPEPETDDEAEVAEPTPPDAPSGAAADVAADVAERTPHAAERLRNSTGDARLSMPLPDHIVAVRPEEWVRLRMAWAIEAINDSTAAAAEARRRATDWTYTDEDGGRWGVSEGKLHLGDRTIPLPSFGAPYDQDALVRGWRDADLARAAVGAAARETRRERARAIREREDRRRARADTTGGGG